MPPRYTTTEEGEYINAFKMLNDPGYNIPEIPAGEFLEFFLPQLKEDIVTEQVFATLRDEGLLEAIDDWYKCGVDRMSGVNRRKDESLPTCSTGPRSPRHRLPLTSNKLSS